MKKRTSFITLVMLGIPALFLLSFTKEVQNYDISGTWVLNVKTAQGNGKPKFILKQENDSQISGTYTGQFGTAPVKGIISGNAFEFEYTIRDITVKYIGTIEGNKMVGKSIYGSLGEGSFTGKKIKSKK